MVNTRRRAIAEIIGYHCVPCTGVSNEGLFHITLDGSKFSKWVGRTEDKAWDVAFRDDCWLGIPNWPTNSADALALCQSIARERNTALIVWHESNEQYDGPMTHFADDERAIGSTLADANYDSKTADALALLALNALKGIT